MKKILNNTVRRIEAIQDRLDAFKHSETGENIEVIKDAICKVFKRIVQAIGFIIECVVSIISIGIAILILEAMFM